MPGLQCPECSRPAFYFKMWIHRGEAVRASLVVWPDGREGVVGEQIMCYWCGSKHFDPFIVHWKEKWFDTETLRVVRKPVME